MQQREMVLRESHARYRNLFERTPAALMCIDAGGRIRSVNRNAIQLLGYTAPELLDKPLANLFVEGPTGKDRARELLLWLERMIDAEIHEEELELHTPDGRNLWVILAVRAARDAKGEIIEFSAALTDISRAHHAEDATRDADARVRRMYTESPCPLFRATVKGQITECNEAFAQLLGYNTRQDAARKNWLESVSPEIHEKLISALERTGKLQAEEIVVKHANGSTAELLITATLHTDKDSFERVVEGVAIETRGRAALSAEIAALKTENQQGKEREQVLQSAAAESAREALSAELAAMKAENERYRTLIAGIAREVGTAPASTSPAGRSKPSVPAPAPAIPNTPSPAARQAVEAVAAAPANSTPVILLAEKDAGVRTVLRSVLQADGYSVLEAPTGSEAVAVSAQQQHPIDLLVTGASMPDMSGHELARCISHLHRRTKVMFLADNRKGSSATSEGFVLGREFTPADLSKAVRQVLNN
jgi:PAS domain S-box-containing protein